jgi:hypothetical protein
VSLTVYEHCRRGWQHGRSELIEVSDEVVEMAECDAQHTGTSMIAPTWTRGERSKTSRLRFVARSSLVTITVAGRRGAGARRSWMFITESRARKAESTRLIPVSADTNLEKISRKLSAERFVVDCG